MNMLVIGCGRVGSELAYRLFLRGHQVVVVDQSAETFHNLPADFRGRLIEGQALNQDVLTRAGIGQADGLAAVTSSDSVNAVIAHIAKQEFNVPTVVVRNFDSRRRPMMEVFGHQIVSSASWGAQRIEELLYRQETRTVFSAGNGEVELYEFSVRPEWHNRPLGELLPEKNCLAVALTRAGRAILPDKDTVVMEGDVILISATLEGSQELKHKLNNHPNPTSMRG